MDGWPANYQRLTNLGQTDPLPFLCLPCIYPPAVASSGASFTAADVDPNLVDGVLRLLQQADCNSLYGRRDSYKRPSQRSIRSSANLPVWTGNLSSRYQPWLWREMSCGGLCNSGLQRHLPASSKAYSLASLHCWRQHDLGQLAARARQICTQQICWQTVA